LNLRPALYKSGGDIQSALENKGFARSCPESGTQVVLGDPDLAGIVNAWPMLPPAIKAAIFAVVNTVTPPERV
jgi:hypothetical protein